MAFIRDLFSSPEPPPPVDYAAIGQQQEAANVEAARLGARLARPDLAGLAGISSQQTAGCPDFSLYNSGDDSGAGQVPVFVGGGAAPVFHRRCDVCATRIQRSQYLHQQCGG